MPEYPFTEDGVTAALDVLGDTSEQVAENLRALGVHGSRGMCGACPLAVYLAGLFPGAEVDVNCERIRLERDATTVEAGLIVADHEVVEIETPDPASDFIGDYDDMDRLRYRYLERRTP